MFSERDEFWMQQAIQLAYTAMAQQEVPVGAVLVHEDRLIGSGFNRPISQCDPSAHAEVLAIREGAKTLGNYRLPDSTLYITLEPCMMCVGAIVHARIKKVIFGTHDCKTGAVDSVFEVRKMRQLNHQVDYVGGLFAEQCARLLSEFFKSRR